MANFKKFLWTLAALPLLVSCSDDQIATSDNGANGPSTNPEDGVYMSVDFRPYSDKGSRSFTDGENSSNTGIETGWDYENNIKSVLLVLTDADNKYFASAEISSEKMSVSTDKTVYSALAKFDKSDLEGIYESHPNVQTTLPVRVFIYANPNDQLRNLIKDLNAGTATDWVNEFYQLSSATDAGMWTKDQFLMTNVSMADRLFPPSLDAWNLYSTESHAFDLCGMNNQNTDNEIDNQTAGGSINIHRMAARFDFRDGSQMKAEDVAPEAWNGNGIAGKPFTYAVMTHNDNVLVEAKIINMSLVNLLNSEYYLGRVSANGMDEGATLLGAELPWFSDMTGTITKAGNYVVSRFSNEKRFSLDPAKRNDYFYYPLFDDNGQPATRGDGWFTSRVADVTGKDAKKDLYPEDGTGFYNTWRYVTENTIPRVNGTNASQVNGWSTGIVFKAKLQAGDFLTGTEATYWDKQLAKAFSDTDAYKPILYYYSGNLYCSWEQVQLAALYAAGWNEQEGDDQELPDRAAPLFKDIFGEGGVGSVTVHFTDKDGNEVTKTYTEHTIDADGKPTTTVAPVDEKSLNYLWSQWYPKNVTTPGLGNLNTGLTHTPWVTFRNALTAKNFIIYEPYGDRTDGNGYYCYYYYWNRHNNNYNPSVMGPMEFATVRNNVYKIAVTRLSTLGHPRIPENDPNSPTPDTPDESSDVYLTVNVQVLPWVVRFNNVEF